MIKELKAFVNSMLMNVQLMRVKNIRSIGRNKLRIEHDSGGSVVFNSDGTISITGYEPDLSGTYVKIDGTSTMSGDLDIGGNDVTDVNTLSGTDGNDLTIEVGAGRNIVFVERSS